MIEIQNPTRSKSKESLQTANPFSVVAKKHFQIVMRRLSGSETLVQLTSKNPYHAAIFQALLTGINSEWFQELGDVTQRHQHGIVHPFVTWMNKLDNNRTPENRYQCLIDFNLYRKNEIEVKTSSVQRIKRILEHGLSGEHLSLEEVAYLENLLKASQIPPDEDAQGHSLTQWFAQFDIRKILGDEKFLSLESPKQLINSFRVTVAVTLSILIEVRQLWNERPDPENAPDLSIKNWYSQWNRSILKLKGKFAPDGSAIDILTELLITDLVISRMHPIFLDTIRVKDIGAINNCLKQKRVWQIPKLFLPDYGDFYTEVEEVLAGWLIASLAVQPSDVGKLKSSNFAQEYTPNGRLHLMQIKYYKGRSGTTKETDIISGSDILARALHDYIEELPNGEKLFKQHFNKSLQFPELRSTSSNSRFGLLFRIWSIPEVKQRLSSEFVRAKTSSLFIDAMNAIVNSEAKSTNLKKVEGTDKYKYIFLFRLSHIKTTAVHSKSDRYRESDLVNHNSHSSITEKQAYLTDQNTEWINQCGRVTRLVLHDLQKVVYRPSIDALKRNISELLAKTRLAPESEISENDIKKIDAPHGTFEHIDDNHQLIVADTVDTALNFIHYIKQAETVFEQLVRLRPDFVEQTLIINVEWMSQMLAKMQATHLAQLRYPDLQKILPPIFDYLMQTNE